ncbi:LOW QUALITY PROTEIN: protocadherin beta-16-like [Pyrgilauda ruficollis]|nr:LOW QUALITY PROTEIN: protocadherin beta-16-like [Pyrgilauda ruficollis]
MLGAAQDGGWLFWGVMACGRRSGDRKRRVILFILCVCVCQSGAETLRYSLPEEMERDSFVANIAKDLGVPLSQLAARKARVVSEGNEQLFRLNQNTGVLTAKESLDREEICPQSDTCTLVFKIFFENPLQLIRGEVEVRDVNDNSPVFPEKEMVLKIIETASPGSRFPLEGAQDKDVGINGLQNYSLAPNPHFSLALGTGKNGVKYVELVLQHQLDREEQGELNLLLTATDGGSPPRSGTAQVRILVLDANDNFLPVFPEKEMVLKIIETASPGSRFPLEGAQDKDVGINGLQNYSLGPNPHFSLAIGTAKDGVKYLELVLQRQLDREEQGELNLLLTASDGGSPPRSGTAQVRILVLDANDNIPVFERETYESRLIVLVRDRGQPPRSATATLAVALVDGFSEAHLRVSEEAPAAEPDEPLTLYLIASLVCVSALFLATAVTAVVVKVRRARRSETETLPTFPTTATESSAGSLPRSYVYDVCFAAGTVNSEFRFLRPLFPCFPAGLPPGPGEQRSSVCSQDAANLGGGGDWTAQGSAPVSEDTGPRAAGAVCPANRELELNVSSEQNPWLAHQ